MRDADSGSLSHDNSQLASRCACVNSHHASHGGKPGAHLSLFHVKKKSILGVTLKKPCTAALAAHDLQNRSPSHNRGKFGKLQGLCTTAQSIPVQLPIFYDCCCSSIRLGYCPSGSKRRRLSTVPALSHTKRHEKIKSPLVKFHIPGILRRGANQPKEGVGRTDPTPAPQSLNTATVIRSNLA